MSDIPQPGPEEQGLEGELPDGPPEAHGLSQRELDLGDVVAAAEAADPEGVIRDLADGGTPLDDVREAGAELAAEDAAAAGDGNAETDQADAVDQPDDGDNQWVNLANAGNGGGAPPEGGPAPADAAEGDDDDDKNDADDPNAAAATTAAQPGTPAAPTGPATLADDDIPAFLRGRVQADAQPATPPNLHAPGFIRDNPTNPQFLAHVDPGPGAQQDAQFAPPDAVPTAPDAAPAQQPATPDVVTPQKARLDELQARVDSGKSLKGKDLQEWHALKTQEDRYNTLQAKLDNAEPLSQAEMQELSELQDTFKEGGANAEENFFALVEGLDLDSAASFHSFAEALNTYAEKKSGDTINPLVMNAMREAITSFFEKPQDALTDAEVKARERVFEHLGGMRKDILMIMTHKRRVEAMDRAQKKLVEDISKVETFAKGSINGNDQLKQRAMLKLLEMYGQLANMNANLINTQRLAVDADWKIRIAQRKVKRELGIGNVLNDVGIGLDTLFLCKKVGLSISKAMQNAPLATPLAK